MVLVILAYIFLKKLFFLADAICQYYNDIITKILRHWKKCPAKLILAYFSNIVKSNLWLCLWCWMHLLKTSVVCLGDLPAGQLGAPGWWSRACAVVPPAPPRPPQGTSDLQTRCLCFRQPHKDWWGQGAAMIDLNQAGRVWFCQRALSTRTSARVPMTQLTGGTSVMPVVLVGLWVRQLWQRETMRWWLEQDREFLSVSCRSRSWTWFWEWAPSVFALRGLSHRSTMLSQWFWTLSIP